VFANFVCVQKQLRSVFSGLGGGAGLGDKYLL